MKELNAILEVLNGWADADLAKIRATHANLTDQVLHRVPPIIPRPQRGGQRPRAMRQDSDPHPPGWGHGRDA